jgi:hypothetical protein
MEAPRYISPGPPGGSPGPRGGPLNSSRILGGLNDSGHSFEMEVQPTGALNISSISGNNMGVLDGGRRKRSKRVKRSKKRRSKKGSKRRSRRQRGGAMYPNDDNTVVVDREDDTPDSVMRVRSYNAASDNPIASQNSSV